MTIMLQATPAFTHGVAPNVRFTVNAWTADNVFLEGEDSIAYRAGDEIRVNPARLLTASASVRDRVAELQQDWSRDEIGVAVFAARKRLREFFQVREGADEVIVELQGFHLRIRAETWRDALPAMAAARGESQRALRAELLDQARLALANRIAAFEWT
jgi:hypothetical protein